MNWISFFNLFPVLSLHLVKKAIDFENTSHVTIANQLLNFCITANGSLDEIFKGYNYII